MRAVVVALILGCLGTPAFANPQAKAAEHYRQGRAYEKAKAYDQAIAEFEAAYAIDGKPGHLFNIGINYESKADLKTALAYFQRYLTAEPKGMYADEARKKITLDTQKLLDDEAKRRADEAKIAAEQKKLKDEQDAAAKKIKDDQDAATKKATVLGHVKQAAAYAQAGAWVKAGEEHRAAATVDNDPQHLLDAADAFHKQPDDVRARDALLAYLEMVPAGDASDKIRVRVAKLAKSIEKAETERATAERQRVSALGAAVSVAKPRGPSRRTSFGFELRGGIYGPTAGFAPPGSSMQLDNRAGLAVGAGAFVDFPLLTASHIHLGLRARTFRSSYEDPCSSIPECPKRVSGTHAGPAVTFEPSLVHRGKWDVYALLGFSVGFAFGGDVSFSDGTEARLGNSFLAETELGFGVRMGSLSLAAVFQGSLTTFNSFDEGGAELGKPAGIFFAAAWALPRKRT